MPALRVCALPLLLLLALGGEQLVLGVWDCLTEILTTTSILLLKFAKWVLEGQEGPWDNEIGTSADLGSEFSEIEREGKEDPTATGQG